MNTFQTQLATDKLAGFDACKQSIRNDGAGFARARVRADVLSNDEAKKDLGFWRGWVHALVSDNLVGA